MMMNGMFAELEDVFDASPDGPIWDTEKSGKLAKIAIQIELKKGLPNGPYYVGKTEITMDNIDSFSFEQLHQASFNHIDRIMRDPNAVLII